MEKISKILKIVTAAASVSVLAYLGWSCVDVYRIGNSAANLSDSGVHIAPVFTRELAAARLAPLLPWMLVYTLLLAVTLVISAKASKQNYEVKLSAENRLRLAKSRVAALPEKAQQEEKKRRNILAVTMLLVLLCAVPCVVYLAKGDNFSSWELESVMGQLALNILPFVAAAFAVMIISVLLIERSMEREISVLKEEASKPAPKTETLPEKKEKTSSALRLALIAAAVLLVALGVVNGGARDVLIKAVNICTECIGLG